MTTTVENGVRVTEGGTSRYGYSHWSKRPPDALHSAFYVPQSIADGWQLFCSCGQWEAFTSFYDYYTKPALLAALKAAHDAHLEKCGVVKDCLTSDCKP